MSRIFVSGLGAVSPAGWGVTAMQPALANGNRFPSNRLNAPGWEKPLQTRARAGTRRASGLSGSPAVAAHQPGDALRGGGRLEALGENEPDRRRRALSSACNPAACNSRTVFSRRRGRSRDGQPAAVSRRRFLPRPPVTWQRCWKTRRWSTTLMGDPAVFLQGLASARIGSGRPRGRLPGHRRGGNQLAAGRRALASGTRRDISGGAAGGAVPRCGIFLWRGIVRHHQAAKLFRAQKPRASRAGYAR